MAPRARLAARWMNSLVFPIFCRRHRTISSASWSMLFFKARKRSPRVLIARRATLERRLVTLERERRRDLQVSCTFPRALKTVWPPLPLPHLCQSPVLILCHIGVKKKSAASLVRAAHAVVIKATLLSLELIIPLSTLSEICTCPPQVHAVNTCSQVGAAALRRWGTFRRWSLTNVGHQGQPFDALASPLFPLGSLLAVSAIV